MRYFPSLAVPEFAGWSAAKLDELRCFDPSIFRGKKTQGRAIFSLKLG